MKRNIKRTGSKAGVLAMAALLGMGTVVNAGAAFTGPAVVQAAEETTQVTTFIDANTTWKYLDDNTDPAAGLSSLTAWTTADFSDSAWKSMVGTIGAKKGVLTAVGTVTPDNLLTQYYQNEEGSNVNIPAYFFRTTFNVDEIVDGASVKGTVQYDDGAIVYLNGEAIAYFGGAEADMAANPTTNLYYLANGTGNEGAGNPAEGAFTIDANKLKKGTNVLAVEVHNKTASSSDVFFGMPSLTMEVEDTSNITQEDVILTVGSNESERNLTWYAETSKAGKVQVAKANGSNEFPADYKEYEATAAASNDSGLYTNQATITGLEAGTSYVYRVVNGDTVSETYSFETGKNGDFTFALVGDPQIGASGNSSSDSDNWDLTLDYIVNTLDPDFLLSAGDQVNTAGSETEYTGYLNGTLASLASATTIGNHDSGSTAYGQHYNLPNESAEFGTSTAGGDYWFVYNNTLFIGINSNDLSTAEHKEFMEAAIAANPDATWKTVFFHHSIYSTASHWNNSDIIDRRNEYPAVFDELGIDVVLMGHDHVYTRSNIMNVGTPTDQGTDSEVYNPDGILYLTANSASGSKYYNLQDGAIEAGYAAKYDQSKRRTVTDITVTDNSYTMTTYFADDGSQLDTYTIYKTDKAELEEAIKNAEVLTEADYTTDSWAVFKEALEAAQDVYAKDDVKQETIDNAVAVLADATAALVVVEVEDDNNDGGQDDTDADNDANVDDDKNVDADTDDADSDAADTEDADSDAADTEDADTADEETSSTPKTGDTTNAMAMALIMSAAAGTIVVANKKRKETEV